MKGISSFQIALMSVFGAIAIAGVMIFALAVGGNTAEEIGTVEIWGTFNSRTIDGALLLAAESDTRFTSVTYIQKDAATYESELTNALASGEGPDLFFLRQDYVVKNAAKVSPIPEEMISSEQFRDTFVEGANIFLSSSGTLAVPLFVDPLVLYWNRDILNDNGYPKPPSSWDELPGIAEVITEKSETGAIGRSAISFGEYSNIPNAKLIVSALILQAGGTITDRGVDGEIAPALAGRTASSTQKAESALRFYTEFADPSKIDYTWNRAQPNARTAFAAGDVALYVGLASEASLLASMNPNLNFAIARLPQIKNSPRHVNTGYVYGLAVSRAAKNPTGALTIAALLATPQRAGNLSSVLGVSSALRDVLAQPAEEYIALFNREALIQRSWFDPDPQGTEEIFRGMIERVTSGSLRLSEAVQRADAEMEELIGI